MELDAVDRELAVLQSHHFAFGSFCCYLKARRQRIATHDQRMVTRRFERIWEALKDPSALMPHRRSFSMHQSPRRKDLAAENRANALMAETNSEDWRFSSEHANNFIADAGIPWPAGTWRNANAVGRQSFNLRDRDFVISLHDHVAAEHPEVLGEVVGERIVIIDDQDLIHRSPG